MKTTLLLKATLIASLFFNVSIYSQTASTIKEVTVYKQTAEIIREGNINLSAGKQEIVFTGISTYINPASLQVQLSNTDKVTLLSAKYERDFLTDKKDNPEIESLKEQQVTLVDEALWLNDQRAIYLGMEEVLKANRDLGGSNAGFTPMQVIELTEVYKTKSFEIRKELNELKMLSRENKKKQEKISKQLREKNTQFNQPSGTIVLQISSKKQLNASFNLKYIVNNAGWTPIYDLRSESIEKNVKLNYKANIYQNTGFDWNNVKINISTGNTLVNNNRPILNPLYTTILNPVYRAMSRMSPVVSSSNMALEEVVETAFDIKRKKESLGYTATVSENQINVTFNILTKQDIKSDGKANMVALVSYDLDTKYIYHSVPKLNKSAFLLAKISDWGKYNLEAGEANIFFEGAYVGKTTINPNVTSKKLLISMGVDNGIIVERKAVKEYTSSKFIGVNTKETIGFEITVLNNKSVPIDIEILDQIPVSNNKKIEITLKEKGTATYSEKIGKLFWELKIMPNQSKKEHFVYSVKYPKKENISRIK